MNKKNKKIKKNRKGDMTKIKQKGGVWPFSSSDDYGYPTYPTYENTSVNPGVVQYLFYFVALVIVLLLVLILVHYTIRPIFKLRPGGQGYIPLPGSDDSKRFWTDITKPLANIQEVDSGLNSQYDNWSMMLDIQVDNPTANTGLPRVLFTRGQFAPELETSIKENDTIMALNPVFNTIIYLDKLTNDLYITVQTVSPENISKYSLESAMIPNVPVGKAIRLGLMIGSHVLEVYVNGYLAHSRTYVNSIRGVAGPIQPPSEQIFNHTARVFNLCLWKRPLSPAEFRSYGTAKSLGLQDIPDSCLAGSNFLSDLAKKAKEFGDTATQLSNKASAAGKAFAST
jgi:hypothetical protein